MKQLINESEAVGKVVEGVETSNRYLAVLFADNTALVLYYNTGYEEMEAQESDDLDAYDKGELGLITEDEYNAILKAQKLRRQEAVEQRERMQYEALKKKFEKFDSGL